MCLASSVWTLSGDGRWILFTPAPVFAYGTCEHPKEGTNTSASGLGHGLQVVMFSQDLPRSLLTRNCDDVPGGNVTTV